MGPAHARAWHRGQGASSWLQQTFPPSPSAEQEQEQEPCLGKVARGGGQGVGRSAGART